MDIPLQVFCCCSHERQDQLLLGRLRKQLHPLERQGLIRVYTSADNIQAEGGWKSKANRYLDTADIILLLISPDFIDSEYCSDIAIPRAMERRKHHQAQVIPIILRPTLGWESLLGESLVQFPTNTKAIAGSKGPRQYEIIYNVAEGIKRIIEGILGPAAFQRPPNVLRENLIDTDFSSPQQTDPRIPVRQRSPSLLRADILPSLETYLTNLARPRSFSPIWRFPPAFPIARLRQRVRVPSKAYSAILKEPQEQNMQDDGMVREKQERSEEIEEEKEPLKHQTPASFSEHITEWKKIRHQVKRAIVLGDAGYGKSLLLASECWSLAQKQLELLRRSDEQHSLLLPIFIPLDRLVSELAKTKDKVLQAIVNVADTPQLADIPPVGKAFRDALYEWVAHYPCFFFFDGFEVVTQKVWEILHPVLNTILMNQDNYILISCRSTNYETSNRHYLSALDISSPKDSEVQRIDLVAFDDYDARHFIAAWLTTNKERETFLRAYIDRYGLNDLVRVPFSLSWLCELVTGERSQLPERRTALYEAILAEYLREVPSEVAKKVEAFVLSVAEKRGDWHLSEKDVKQFFTKKEIAYLTTETRLLNGTEKSSLGSFSFSHDTLHEYTLAAALAHMPDDKIRWQWIEGHCCYDSRWPNVIRFLAGILDKPEPFIDKVRAAFYDLCALSSLLAGECLLEVEATKVSPDLRNKIIADLRHLLSSPAPEEREKAIEILKRLEDKQTEEMLLQWFHRSRFHPARLAPLLALWGGDEIADALLYRLQKEKEPIEDEKLTDFGHIDFSHIFPTESVLASIGGTYVVQKIREILCKRSTCGTLHEAAIRILSSIRERQAVEALFAGLWGDHDEHASCQASIIQCLEGRNEDFVWEQLARYWREGHFPPDFVLAALERRRDYYADWYSLREMETFPACLPLIRSLDARKRYWQSRSTEFTDEQERLPRDDEAIRTILAEYQRIIDKGGVDDNDPARAITHLLVMLGDQHAVEVFFQLLHHPNAQYKRFGVWGFERLFQQEGFSADMLGERKAEVISELFFLFDDHETELEIPLSSSHRVRRSSRQQRRSTRSYDMLMAGSDAREALRQLKDSCIVSATIDNQRIPVARIVEIIRTLDFHPDEEQVQIRKEIRKELVSVLLEKEDKRCKRAILILGHLLTCWTYQEMWLDPLPYEQAIEIICEWLHDQDTQVRWGAIYALKNWKNSRLIEDVFLFLQKQSPSGGVTLSDVLPSGKEAESSDVFCAVLSHGTPMNRQLALAFPEMLTPPQRTEAVRACLRNQETREYAIDTLAKIAGQEAEQDIFPYLHDRRGRIRWTAAKALAKIGSLKSIEYFLQEVRSTDEALQDLAVEALMACDPSCDPRIMECLLDLYLDPEHPWHFHRIQSEYPMHPAAIIAEFWRDEDPTWWWDVGEDQGGLSVDKRVEALAIALNYAERLPLENRYWMVRKLFFLFYPFYKESRSITPQALEGLLKIFEHGDRRIRYHMAIILGYLGCERLGRHAQDVREVLFEILQGNDKDIKRWYEAAAEALVRCGEQPREEVLISLLLCSDLPEQVHYWAAVKLQELEHGPDHAVPALLPLILKESKIRPFALSVLTNVENEVDYVLEPLLKDLCRIRKEERLLWWIWVLYPLVALLSLVAQHAWNMSIFHVPVLIGFSVVLGLLVERIVVLIYNKTRSKHPGRNNIISLLEEVMKESKKDTIEMLLRYWASYTTFSISTSYDTEMFFYHGVKEMLLLGKYKKELQPQSRRLQIFSKYIRTMEDRLLARYERHRVKAMYCSIKMSGYIACYWIQYFGQRIVRRQNNL